MWLLLGVQLGFEVVVARQVDVFGGGEIDDDGRCWAVRLCGDAANRW